MRLIAFGGDMRMEGACLAARKAGWDALHVKDEETAQEIERADAVLLPWPKSFAEEKLVGGGKLTKEKTLSLLPLCRVLLHGSGVSAEEMRKAQLCLNPERDEAFLLQNARLTAEGAVAAAMQKMEGALLLKTCVITGFGRIGRELAARLCAMGMFVIVCARSETQMRMAHALGAHPTPLAQLASVVSQADVVFNTVPARIMGEETLSKIPKNAPVIELASSPYGADPELAKRMGVRFFVESGLPGRYAPMDAGAALFGAVLRTAQKEQEGERNG